MKRLLLRGAGLALSMVPTLALAADATVKVSHNSLIPAKVTISLGDKVTFANQANMPGGHTLVAKDGSFTSKPLPKRGDTWSHTFKKAGTYHYRIREHPDATGTIKVK